MTKGKGHLRLSVGIHIVLLDLCTGAMTEHSFHHRGYLRGGAAFELGVNTGRLLFDMPVNHNSRSPVANMPLGEQILIPGSELLGIGGTGCGSLTPDLREPCRKDGISNVGDRIAELLFVNIATADIAQV